MVALPWFIAALALIALFTIKRLEGIIMSASQDAVDAVVAQLSKATDEIKAEIAALEARELAQLSKATDEIKAEIAALEAREPSVDLSALKNAAQALDDIVPDAPVDTPAE